MRTSVLQTVLVVALVGFACQIGDEATPATRFEANLSGDKENPPVTSPATGTATFTLNGANIDYTLTVSGITNWTVAHIHVATAAGATGGVRLNMCGTGAPEPACPATGGTVTGSGTAVGGITLDSLVTAMRANLAYANVHTNATGCTPGTPGCNSGGEIRGFIVAKP
jgi:hypothetical protein